jgi:DNA gyrase subunit A
VRDLIKAKEALGREKDLITAKELRAILEQFGDRRRTEILEERLDLSLEDLITEEDVVVTISHAGYEVAAAGLLQAQRRGGTGKSATNQGRGLHRAAVHRQH